MAMDLSSLGILVKDAQGNLQEKKLEDVLGVAPQPIIPKLQDFRQQLAKVTGETGYQLPKKQPVVNVQQSATPQRHLSGPIEELGSLTITDLHHWGTKEEIIRHIKEAVALLNKDSMIMRARGVRAWQKSPLHQLYLEIGRQSMMEDKPLGQVLDERAKSGQPTLTLDEFESLMEANEQLRY